MSRITPEFVKSILDYIADSEVAIVSSTNGGRPLHLFYTVGTKRYTLTESGDTLGTTDSLEDALAFYERRGGILVD